MQEKSGSLSAVPRIEAQAEYWRTWNESEREGRINHLAERQAQTITSWIRQLGRHDLDILEVGCGSGWLCERLVGFGKVTGIDLSEQMFISVRSRIPDAHFVAGDILDPSLKLGTYDVLVAMAVIAHVNDQVLFLRRCNDLLRPGGVLLLTVQNRPIYSRMLEVAPASHNQVRNWLSAEELRAMTAGSFHIAQIGSIEPRGYGGFLRLVNSVKLNQALNRLFTEQRITAWKERLMLGCMLTMKAIKGNVGR